MSTVFGLLAVSIWRSSTGPNPVFCLAQIAVPFSARSGASDQVFVTFIAAKALHKPSVCHNSSADLWLIGLIIAIAYLSGPQYRAPKLRRGFDSMSDFDLNGYKPSTKEDFMNAKQKAYFRQKLEDWKAEILDGAKVTIGNLRAESSNHPDLVDRASAESDKALELRTRDRQRKLVAKIDAALRRIDEGEYGYCEETGEPISLKRLDARPIATMSLEAQERHERREKVHRDD